MDFFISVDHNRRIGIDVNLMVREKACIGSIFHVFAPHLVDSLVKN